MYLFWRINCSLVALLCMNTSCCNGMSQSVSDDIEMLKVDSLGSIALRHRVEINIRAIPTKALKSLEILDEVKLIWDSNTPPVVFDELTTIKLEDCRVNPHAFRFTSNLTRMYVRDSTLDNGTISDLLSTANNLRKLVVHNYQYNRKKLLLNIESLPYNTLEELEVHYGVMYGFELGYCEMVGNYWDRECSQPVYFQNLEKLSLNTVEVNMIHIRLGEKLKTLKLEFVKFINGTGTLEDFLKTIENLEYLTLNTPSIDIAKLPGIKSLREFSVTNADITCTQNRVVFGTLQPNEDCRSPPYFQDLEELTFENVEFNPAHIRLGDKLKKLKISIGKDGYQHPLLQLLELADLSDVHLKTLTQLSVLILTDEGFGYTTNNPAKLVNGQVEDFLCTITGLNDLEFSNSIEIPLFDISKLSCLKALREMTVYSYNGEITFGDNSVVFETLQALEIHSMSLIPRLVSPDTAHFNTTFSNISRLRIKSVIGPSLLLSALRIKNLKYFGFIFDSKPQKSSYDFGECVKFMNAIKLTGKGQGKYYNLFRCNKKLCRIRWINIQKNMLDNGSFEWQLLSEQHTGGTYEEYEESPPEKPLGSKLTIYIYCTILVVTTSLGFFGNSISAIVLVKSKMSTSPSGIVLLSLTFCDSAIIITYIITFFFSIELFYGFFLKLEDIDWYFEVREHSWTASQNWIQAMTVYPVNKIGYTGSVYLTVLISVERFVAICFPLKSKIILSYRNTRLSIIVVFVFSLILNSPRWFESVEWDFYSEDSLNWNEYYKPTLMRMHWYVVMYHQVLWPVLMYIIPFLAIGLFNFKIIQQMRISLRARQSLATGINATDQVHAEMASLNRMLLCVVAVFVLCNGLHIILVFYFFFGYEGIEPSTIEAVAGFPLIINSSVNFVIYVGLVGVKKISPKVHRGKQSRFHLILV